MTNKRFRISGYYLMIIPVLIVVAIFFIYPIVRVIYLSFYKYSPTTQKWLGFKAYSIIASDGVFWASLLRLLIYVAVVVAANFLIGIVFAMLTYRTYRGVRVLRLIFILPMLLIPSAGAVTWALLYNEEFGFINHLLKLVGVTPQMWLAKGLSGFIAVMITDIWSWVPFMYLILLAGLQSISDEPIEAAQIDGANRWKIFWFVLLPMIRPTITVGIILKTMGVFKTFEYIWIMTNGGPGDKTQVLSTYIFSRAFNLFEYGKSSTASVIMLAIGIIVAVALMRFFKEGAAE